MRFAPEGLRLTSPIILIAVLLGLGAAIWGVSALFWWATGLILIWFLVLLFFRDPERQPPSDPNAVLSPADGRVIESGQLADGRQHVAIFLSVFNVHVNRVPVSGKATAIRALPGGFFHAGSGRAAAENARVEVEAHSSFGTVAWRQVAGAIARKISCRLKVGDSFKAGDRFGLIYFGSRMDVFLPSAARITTHLGDRVKAGESVIAIFEDKC